MPSQPYTPTIGEILNNTVDAERGTGTPAVVFDNRQLVSELNQNARFKAENDWNKYTTFLRNWKDALKDVGDISKEPIMQEDRPALMKRQAEIYKKIGDNPKSVFSGGGKAFFEIQGDLARLRTDATESKLNRKNLDVHHMLLEHEPSFATQENVTSLDNYQKQELGKRKLDVFKMPTQFDMEKFAKGLLANPSVKRPEFNTELTPDKKFIQSSEKTTYKHDNFMSLWDSALDMKQDKYGHSGRSFAEQQYKEASEANPNFKKQYPEVEDYWHDLGEKAFGQKEDIITTDKGKLTTNPFELEQKKAADKLAQLKQKFNYDAALERVKQKGREGIEGMKESFKTKPEKEKREFLDNLISGMVNDAISKPTHIQSGEFKGFKMDVSQNILKLFPHEEQEEVGLKTVKKNIFPDIITVSPDGKTVSARFYKPLESGEDKNVRSVEESKTKTFPIDEFKARVGKDLLGIKTLGESLDKPPKGAEIEENKSEYKKVKTFNVIDPNTGETLMEGIDEEKANKAKSKGYKIQ